jgi:hypothetical protein
MHPSRCIQVGLKKNGPASRAKAATFACFAMRLLSEGMNQPGPEFELTTLFPHLDGEALKEACEFLEAYSEITLRIFERLEDERRQTFDDEPVGP